MSRLRAWVRSREGRREQREAAWREAATRLGGRFEEGGGDWDDRLVVPREGGGCVVLQMYLQSRGNSSVPMTRARAYYVGRRELRFTVRNRNVLDRMLGALGWGRDPPSGREFTDRFVVRGKPWARLPSVLGPDVVGLLLRLEKVRVEVKRPSRKARRRYGEDAGVVVCRVTGKEHVADRLVRMAALGGAVLDGLARVGESRAEDAPCEADPG